MEPKWAATLFAKQIDGYFGNGFRFTGPGWYRNNSNTDSLLIVPLARQKSNFWDPKYEPDEPFCISCYGSDAREKIELMQLAPEYIT